MKASLGTAKDSAEVDNPSFTKREVTLKVGYLKLIQINGLACLWLLIFN